MIMIIIVMVGFQFKLCKRCLIKTDSVLTLYKIQNQEVLK